MVRAPTEAHNSRQALVRQASAIRLTLVEKRRRRQDSDEPSCTVQQSDAGGHGDDVDDDHQRVWYDQKGLSAPAFDVGE